MIFFGVELKDLNQTFWIKLLTYLHLRHYQEYSLQIGNISLDVCTVQGWTIVGGTCRHNGKFIYNFTRTFMTEKDNIEILMYLNYIIKRDEESYSIFSDLFMPYLIWL